MSRLPIVAVVGRPNIGKSTLVNRILGRREAVVEEVPGVTRDRREFEAEWLGRRFLLIDTGGWQVEGDDLTTDISAQAEAAIGAADVILFVVDATTALAPDDDGVARLVRRGRAPVLLVANKADGPSHESLLDDFWSLGLGQPHPVSALHGRGVGDVLDLLLDLLPEVEDVEEEHEGPPRISIIGRPNVGKSTLLNQLLGEERVLVSPVPGTTRDPIDVLVEIDGEPYELVDTAGIRRAPKVAEAAEFYAVKRAQDVLERTDVALLVIDGTEGVTHQDQRIAELAVESGAGLVILLNKWDAVDEESREWTELSVPDRLGFVGWAPVLRMSAKTGARLKRLGPTIEGVLSNRTVRMGTGELNRLVRTWQGAHPPPVRKGRRTKVMYAVQPGIEPPTFVLFVAGGDLGEDYLRYIENRLREVEDFTGSPIRIVVRQRERRK
ncbi:MAG: ribosome biogenesis GTPase Der [Acidimicrobiia bacterium]|nr:MAG: ribosome biogenesis GTPase Der [Acidimicrobiia bacterium]